MLASKGAHVLITGLDEKRGMKAAEEICKFAGHEGVHFYSVDHSSIADNIRLAEQISSHIDRLDVLINNVGGTGPADRRETGEGFEFTYAMNVLGPFALTKSLLTLLRKAAPSRIINITSSAAYMWKRDPLIDMDNKENYVAMNAYAHAKLLNLIWTLALARRLVGTGIVANATNPGMAWTNNTASLTPEAIPQWKYIWPLVRWFQRRASAEVASKSSVFLATSEEVANVTGTFFESNTKPKKPASSALDVKCQDRFWEIAESHVMRALVTTIRK